MNTSCSYVYICTFYIGDVINQAIFPIISIVLLFAVFVWSLNISTENVQSFKFPLWLTQEETDFCKVFIGQRNYNLQDL